MAQKTRAQLLAEINIIRNETEESGNTCVRIANTLQDISDSAALEPGGNLFRLPAEPLIDNVYTSIGGEGRIVSWDGSNHMWVTTDSGQILRINRLTNVIDTVIAGIPGSFVMIHDNGLHMLISSYPDNTIYRFLISDGTFFDSFTTGIGNGPLGMAFDGLGRLYVANNADSSVSIFDYSTPVPTLISTIPGLPSPVGLIWDNGSNMYVSCSGSNELQRISTASLTIVGSPIPTGTSPFFMDKDSSNNIYVANSGGGVTKVVNNVPTFINTGYPGYKVAYDGKRSVYATTDSLVIAIIDTEDNSVTYVTGDSGFTNEIAYDGLGHIYATDYNLPHVFTILTPIEVFPSVILPGENIEFDSIGTGSPLTINASGYAGSYVISDPISITVDAFYAPVGPGFIDVGPSTSKNTWICRLNLDMFSDVSSPLSFRISYAIDGGPITVSPGSTSIVSISSGTNQLNLLTVMEDITAATSLVFYVEMESVDSSLSLTIERLCLVVEKTV
jgi:hypothetical protein